MEFTNDREVRVYDLSPAQSLPPEGTFFKKQCFQKLDRHALAPLYIIVMLR